MFGIAQPCRHVLGPELRREWMGHLCGLCLALRDGHGQAARVTTNVDAVVLSILVDAQRVVPLERERAAPCPLRGMQSATVIAGDEPAAQHAVAVSLTMAATKVEDHALDRDGLPGRVPALSRGVSRRWSSAGEVAGRRASFETKVLRAAVADSNARELRCGLTFDDYVAPTEEAAAAAVAHTAVLADRPENREHLRRIGTAFGRITYLLDAVEDEADDIEQGRFNPLVAVSDDPAERRALATRLFVEAHTQLRTSFDALALERPDLARAVLVDQLWRAGDARLDLDGRRCSIHGQHRRRRFHVHKPAIDLRETAGAVRVLARLAIFTGLATAAAFDGTAGPLPGLTSHIGRRKAQPGADGGIMGDVAEESTGCCCECCGDCCCDSCGECCSCDC